MTKYFFLISLILSVACKEGFQNSDDNRPNIIFMMSDDHTSQAWGIYGGVLENYVINKNIKRSANGSSCEPARWMVTGLWPPSIK